MWLQKNDNEVRPITPEDSLDAQLLHFLVVILAVEDVPLLRAFSRMVRFLTFDFQARRLVDSRFLVQEIFKNLAGFLPDGVRDSLR